jgi:hypothetical protein
LNATLRTHRQGSRYFFLFTLTVKDISRRVVFWTTIDAYLL